LGKEEIWYRKVILENDRVAFVVKGVGSEASYTSINTSELILEMRIKDVDVNVTPVDSSIIIDGDPASSAGIGYSKLVKMGENMREGQIVVYVESGSGANYEVWYTLLSGADFVMIEVKNAYYR
jgi:hypothetical protein